MKCMCVCVCVCVCVYAGVYIDVILTNWSGRYDILEARHDYIQWCCESFHNENHFHVLCSFSSSVTFFTVETIVLSFKL